MSQGKCANNPLAPLVALLPATKEDRLVKAAKFNASLPPEVDRFARAEAERFKMPISHFLTFLITFYHAHLEEARQLVEPWPPLPIARAFDPADSVDAMSVCECRASDQLDVAPTELERCVRAPAIAMTALPAIPGVDCVSRPPRCSAAASREFYAEDVGELTARALALKKPGQYVLAPFLGWPKRLYRKAVIA